MTREIKFRAWIDGKMNYHPVLWGSHESGECWPNASIYEQQQRGEIWMQFTGLKDKNGKEIYEGDIVEYFHWCHAAIEYDSDSSQGKIAMPFTNAYGDSWIDRYDPLVGLVAWDNKLLTYAPIVDLDYEGSYSFGSICVGKDEDYPEAYFEVIGNIFENPELLPTETK